MAKPGEYTTIPCFSVAAPAAALTTVAAGWLLWNSFTGIVINNNKPDVQNNGVVHARIVENSGQEALALLGVQEPIKDE